MFKSVVDEGGVIKAAHKLHRVPSAVTTRIKQLEASMGVKLFHRDKQRLYLSPAGELLLGYAERLIQLSEEARDVVTGTTPRGTFKLGALESTTASRLPPILAAALLIAGLAVGGVGGAAIGNSMTNHHYYHHHYAYYHHHYYHPY